MSHVPQSPPFAPHPPQKSTNAMAVVAFILGVFGLFSFGVVTVIALASLAAVFLGHLSLGQIKKRGMAGKPLAIPGLVMGYVGVAMWIVSQLFKLVTGASLLSVVASAVVLNTPMTDADYVRLGADPPPAYTSETIEADAHIVRDTAIALEFSEDGWVYWVPGSQPKSTVCAEASWLTSDAATFDTIPTRAQPRYAVMNDVQVRLEQDWAETAIVDCGFSEAMVLAAQEAGAAAYDEFVAAHPVGSRAEPTAVGLATQALVDSKE